MKAKDIKLDHVNNMWREVITLSSTLYTEITTVFVKTLRAFDSWIVTRLNKLEGGELLTSDLLVFEENLTVCLSRNTAKRTQVAANLLVDHKSVLTNLLVDHKSVLTNLLVDHKEHSQKDSGCS